jgi:hypothetical protein
MAVLVPTATQVISNGNMIEIQGTFSAISDNDTWAPGFVTVAGAQILNGASGQTVGATYSGGTVTIRASGALANVKIRAIGT